MSYASILAAQRQNYMNISLIGWSHLGSLIVKNLRQPWHKSTKATIKRSLGPKSQLKDPVLLQVWYCDNSILRVTLHHIVYQCDVADRWVVVPCSIVEDGPGAKLGISQVHIHTDMRHTSFFKATTPLKSPRPLSSKYSENHPFWS